MMRLRLVAYLLLVAVFSSSCYAEEKLQDPTRPPPDAIVKPGVKKVTTLKLTEIRINDNDRLAVVNGKRLRKGNSIAGYKLKKIAVGYVILANAKRTLRLNLINSRVIRKNL
jgi:hypothetical protein